MASSRGAGTRTFEEDAKTAVKVGKCQSARGRLLTFTNQHSQLCESDHPYNLQTQVMI